MHIIHKWLSIKRNLTPILLALISKHGFKAKVEEDWGSLLWIKGNEYSLYDNDGIKL